MGILANNWKIIKININVHINQHISVTDQTYRLIPEDKGTGHWGGQGRTNKGSWAWWRAKGYGGVKKGCVGVRDSKEKYQL